MRLDRFSGRAATRGLVFLACFGALAGLSACGGDETATGTPYTQALAKNYTDLSNQAAALPAPPDDEGFFSSLFNIFGSSNPNDELASAFSDKASAAGDGDEPEPEAAPADAASQALRARLVRDVTAAKERAPTEAARAMADFDCWVMASAVPSAAGMGQGCRGALEGELAQLEGGARPAPAPSLPPSLPPLRSRAIRSRRRLQPLRPPRHPRLLRRRPRPMPAISRSISTSIPGP